MPGFRFFTGNPFEALPRVIGEGMVVCTNIRPSISRKVLREGRIMEMGVEAVASPKSPRIESRAGMHCLRGRNERVNSVDQLPVLSSRKVLLRPPRESDKLDRLGCGRHAEFIRMVGGDHLNATPMIPEQVDRWYDRLWSDSSWVIAVDGRCIGTARLHQLDSENRRARYAIGIFDKAFWGWGLGTEATRLVLGYAFNTLGLHRVDLRVLAYNQRAIACYENCGFVREGVEREGALIAGEWHSDVIMSILEREYREASRAW